MRLQTTTLAFIFTMGTLLTGCSSGSGDSSNNNALLVLTQPFSDANFRGSCKMLNQNYCTNFYQATVFDMDFAAICNAVAGEFNVEKCAGSGVTGMSRDVSWGLYIANFTFGVGLAGGRIRRTPSTMKNGIT